jgi:hypothetical protein
MAATELLSNGIRVTATILNYHPVNEVDFLAYLYKREAIPNA